MNDKKIYHTIGQVSEYLELPQSVLRYWETVFKQFDPHKSPGGNRLYTDEDIKLVKRIKELLYEQKFTIKGANSQLEKEFASEGAQEFIGTYDAEAPVLKSSEEDGVVSKEELKGIVNKLKELINYLEN